MFIGLSGFPVRRQRCSENRCRKHFIPTLKVAYHFPLWLLARVVHFVLVNGGANLNSQDCHQRTPLGYAAKMGKSKGLGYLHSAGADTGRVDIYEFPPLFETLLNNHPECLRFLLQHDLARVFVVPPRRKLYSNHGTLDTFADHGSKQFGIEAPSTSTTTPQDLFDQREDKSAEL